MAKQQWVAYARVSRARRLGRIGACVVAAIAVLGWLAAEPALAHHVSGGATYESAGPVFEWILLDAETGQVLSEQNADVLTYPASLTKMMTLYLTFEALNQGRIRLDQSFPVSQEAANHSPSKLALVPGDSVTIRDLILGIVTKSANDAAAVLAEGLGGSEAQFAQNMTWKARQLGMQHTWYHNASGLPDPQQRSTARDVARLALALYQHFPREYRYFQTTSFEFRGETVHTHNHLLEWYQGLDGIKTGFVNASGFNLAASAVRDGHRLIGVIMGGSSARGRDRQMASLLDQGFALLASGRFVPQQQQPVAQPAAPLVASTMPAAPIASASAAPPRFAAPVAAAAAAPVARAAVATAETPSAADPSGKEGMLGKVAQAALKHLAPVGKAEAAPLAHEAPAAAADSWAIQIGAFRAMSAADRAARRVAAMPVARGKPAEVAEPAHGDSDRLYRARVLHFSAKGAQAACAELKRRGMACTIIRPAGVRVASQ